MPLCTEVEKNNNSAGIRKFFKLINEKNLFRKKCMKNDTTEAWIEYQKCRNKLSHLKENSEKPNYHTLINEHKNNNAKLW